jgi:phage baseplate assembly protein gpV
MAGSRKNGFETSLLQHIFQNADIANIGDAGGLQNSASAGNFYIALYTSAPSDSAQGTETSYTNYARVAVARSAGGWTVSGNNCSNAAAVTFATCGVTGATIVAFSINTGATAGVDDAIYWADLTSNLVVSAGITPSFAIGELDINAD